MKNFIKTVLPIACAVVGFQASATDYELDINFKVNPAPGEAACSILSTPVFDIGNMPTTGVYFYDITMQVQCEDSQQGFNIMYPRAIDSDGITVYSDDYLDIYVGYPSEISPDGFVRHNGIPNPARNGCVYNSSSTSFYKTFSVDAGGEISLFPAGGNISTAPSSNNRNRNACSYVINKSPTGFYTMEMKAVATLHTMPEGDDLDNMPTNVVLPLQFLPTVPTNSEPELVPIPVATPENLN